MPRKKKQIAEVKRMMQTGDEDSRFETGPIQFDDDWPGVFIRGDDAMAYSMALRGALERLASFDDGRLEGAKLVDLVDLLSSCRVTQS